MSISLIEYVLDARCWASFGGYNSEPDIVLVLKEFIGSWRSLFKGFCWDCHGAQGNIERHLWGEPCLEGIMGRTDGML